MSAVLHHRPRPGELPESRGLSGLSSIARSLSEVSYDLVAGRRERSLNVLVSIESTRPQKFSEPPIHASVFILDVHHNKRLQRICSDATQRVKMSKERVGLR